MRCCTPEAPEHERFGRLPVPYIKGESVARDVGPQLVGSSLSALGQDSDKADIRTEYLQRLTCWG